MANRLHIKNTTPTVQSAAFTEYDSGSDGGVAVWAVVSGEVFTALGNFSIRPVWNIHDGSGGDYACLTMLGNGAGAPFNFQLRSDNGAMAAWNGSVSRTDFTNGDLYVVYCNWTGSGNEQLSILHTDGTVIMDSATASFGGALPSLTGLFLDLAPSTGTLQNQDSVPRYIDGAAIAASSIGHQTGDARRNMPTGANIHHAWDFDETSGTTTTDKEGSVDFTIAGGTDPTDREWVGSGYWGAASGTVTTLTAIIETESIQSLVMELDVAPVVETEVLVAPTAVSNPGTVVTLSPVTEAEVLAAPRAIPNLPVLTESEVLVAPLVAGPAVFTLTAITEAEVLTTPVPQAIATGSGSNGRIIVLGGDLW